jgi:hypothetical protein
MNAKIALAAALLLSLSAPAAWSDPVPDGFSAAEGFLTDIAGQSIQQTGLSACAADNAVNPGSGEDGQVSAACQAARAHAAKKAAEGQTATAETATTDDSLQNADALGDALGNTVSDFSPPEQKARSAAHAGSRVLANTEKVAAAGALKKGAAAAPAPSGHYGPSRLNQTVPTAFKAAEQAASGLNQQ